MIRFDGLECEIVFEKFTMLEFNTIDVDITGFSFLNPIARKIAEWIVDYFNNYIVKEIAEEYARNFLNLALSDKRSLQRLLGYAITGMVLESSGESSESNVNSLQINRNIDDHPVAPLRQRRKTSNSVSDSHNNLNGSYASLDRQTYTTVPPPSFQVLRPNNAQHQQSEPRLQMNGSAGHRLPEGTLRNDLTGKRNEIIIRPKKLFSTKPSGMVEINYIPMKPAML